MFKISFNLLLVLIALAYQSRAQVFKIEGAVKDQNLQNLVSATVQLKNAKNQSVIAYVFTDKNGLYALNANLPTGEKLYLIASYLGFKRDTLIINTLKPIANTIQHNFVLQTDLNQLKEISITAPKSSIEVVNDTTKYNVAKFTTPDDKNLEAVIEKMPGMEVSKDGTIFFKKKKISKVLLENDDLTGENYKAITQNLKPELVNEVQAIENWIEDDLLRGIINIDDIVLNLTLKDKRKQKIIGSVDAGYGLNDRHDLAANVITFVNKTKAFAFGRSNNIGMSQEFVFSLADMNRKMGSDGKLIQHQISTYTPFDANAMALNNSLSGSLNSITRFSPNFKLSANLYGLRNKLYGDNSTTSIYYEPLNVISVNQQNQQSKNKQYQADLNTDYLVASNARLTTKFTYKFKPQIYNALAFSSFNSVNGDIINQTQNDDIINYNADLKFTLKANTTSALIVNAKLVKDNVDQDYQTSSDVYQTIPIFNGFKELMQEVNIEKNLLNVNAQGLKRIRNGYLYGNVGIEYADYALKSKLSKLNSDISINGFLNDNKFITNNIYAVGKYSYKAKGKFNFQTTLKAAFINQQFNGADSSFLAIEPDVALNFKISTFQSTSLRYSYKNTLANPADYYSNSILVDLRSVNTGINKLYNFGKHQLNFTYNNNELGDKYFSFNINADAQYSEGGFLTTNFFENTIYYNQKMPYKGLKNISSGVSLEKFLPLISSKFTVNYTSSFSNFYGKVAEVINEYKAINHVLNAKASTGFKLPVNFTVEFQFQNNVTKLAKDEINNQNVYKYSLQSRYKISEKLFNLTDFNRYNIAGSNYNLLNTELKFSPKKGNFKYALYGKNLLNVKSIDNTFVSNVSENKSSASILGRYVLGSISMSIK